jgi:hypothetical protein
MGDFMRKGACFFSAGQVELFPGVELLGKEDPFLVQGNNVIPIAEHPHLIFRLRNDASVKKLS